MAVSARLVADRGQPRLEDRDELAEGFAEVVRQQALGPDDLDRIAGPCAVRQPSNPQMLFFTRLGVLDAALDGFASTMNLPIHLSRHKRCMGTPSTVQENDLAVNTMTY